jgi:hypothetical protein
VTATSRGNDELREYASTHLKYDVLMLRRTQELMAFRPGARDPMGYALLESFTIHTRVLVEFFYTKREHPDDVRAADYAPGWSEGLPKLFSESVLNVDRRINAEIAHASIKRLDVTEELKPWPHRKIREQLEKTLVKFLKLVDPANLIGDGTREVLAPQAPIQFKTVTLTGIAPSSDPVVRYFADTSLTSTSGLRLPPVIPEYREE